MYVSECVCVCARFMMKPMHESGEPNTIGEKCINEQQKAKDNFHLQLT